MDHDIDMTKAFANLPKVTLVTPVYNEEASLETYRDQIKKILFSVSHTYFEVIFVDDGSTDNSWAIIEKICREMPERFQGLRLSRNFGAHIADSAGVHHATGDAVVSVACDLQDPPETVLEFVEKWRQGAKIVWGKRRERADDIWRKWSSDLFFLFLKKYAMPKNSKFCTGGFILIDREVVDCVKLFKEQHRLNYVLAAWTGFEQEVVLYDRQARVAGKSNWNFLARLKTFSDVAIGFSNFPARLITTIGLGTGIFSFALALYLIITYFSYNVLSGWTSLMVMISFMFGTLFFVLGLNMEYLRRIHTEVISRPLYFVAKQINIRKSESS